MGAGPGTPREPGWVLVVMADAMRRMAIFRLLEWAGHRATVVDTARAALGMLETEPFDLVLLDASLPAQDGYELLRRIRLDPKLGRLPVLMVAAQGDAGAVGPWIEMGADDSLVEPFVPAVVRARVNASLADKRTSDREVEHTAGTGRIVGREGGTGAQ